MILSWLIFCILVGLYAMKKGRSFFGFFILSIVLSPLIGFCFALLYPPNTELLDNELSEDNNFWIEESGEVKWGDYNLLDERSIEEIAEDWKNSYK